MIVAGAAFLHLLVFVYWLGGDLGAFYASYLAVGRDRPAAARLTAVRILNAVDTAPGAALILALPTGLALAAAKAWLAVPPAALAAVWVGALAWLVAFWRVHSAPGQARPRLVAFDLAMRGTLLAALSLAGAAGLARLWPAPLFLALKLLALAAAVARGLLIRAQLKPLGPALAALAGGDEDGAADAAIRGLLARSRPLVLGIWLLTCAAALLGLAKPQWG